MARHKRAEQPILFQVNKLTYTAKTDSKKTVTIPSARCNTSAKHRLCKLRTHGRNPHQQELTRKQSKPAQCVYLIVGLPSRILRKYRNTETTNIARRGQARVATTSWGHLPTTCHCNQNKKRRRCTNSKSAQYSNPNRHGAQLQNTSVGSQTHEK